MPSVLTRPQWMAHYAVDPVTTADAARLGDLIALNTSQALAMFLQAQPDVSVVSVGYEYGQWEVFARPGPRRFDRNPDIRRLFATEESWGFAEGSVATLKGALHAGKIPFLMANPAVAARVAASFSPTIPVKPWQSREALANRQLAIALPPLVLPEGPVWPLARLEQLDDTLVDTHGWSRAIDRRTALAEVIGEIPKAPQALLDSAPPKPVIRRPRTR